VTNGIISMINVLGSIFFAENPYEYDSKNITTKSKIKII
jgi:hypothetical protein